MNAGNGALRDKELASKVEKAAAFMKGREPKPTGEEVVFDKLFGTFNITNGLSDNKDFKFTNMCFRRAVELSNKGFVFTQLNNSNQNP